MPATQKISVKRISGALGAEVEGVHLGNLRDDIYDEVRKAFLEHQVLFFRDQEITRDQHKDFGAPFPERCKFILSCSPSRTRVIPSSWCCTATKKIPTSPKRGIAM